MQDLVVPGMLHGRVIRPPAIGAKLISVDESSIRKIPHVNVVRIENFLGVVSNDEWAAVRAARELKAIWSDWQGLPGSDDIERHVRRAAADHDEAPVNKGDAARRCQRRQSNFPPCTLGLIRVTLHLAHPARWPTCGTTARPSGPPRKEPMACAQFDENFRASRGKMRVIFSTAPVLRR